MEYFLLIVTAFTVSVQNIFKQRYNVKAHGGVFLFSALVSAVSALIFAAINTDWSYNISQLPYSLGFAASYCVATLFSVLAIRTGPLAKTNFILSCSLLIPTFYGIIFLNDAVKLTLILGIAVLIGAMVLTNYTKDDKNDKKITARWLIYVALAFIGNGMCSTVQKMEIEKFGDSGKNVFMIIALSCVVLAMLIPSVVLKDERKELKSNLKLGWLLIVLCGCANGITNVLTMYLNTKIPASIMFPVISALAMTLVFVYSVTVVKEKYSTVQKIGYVCGIISVVLLNL